MGKQHIIEVNGKRYDALTGKMLGEASTKNQSLPKSHSKPTLVSNMDGFARRSPQPALSAQQRPVQKSKTLMRKTVLKPQSHKVHAVATIVHQQPVSLPAAPSRLEAHQKPIPKHPLIRKFSPSTYEKPQPAIHNNPQSQLRPVANAHLAKAAADMASVAINPLHQALANATSHQKTKLKRPQVHKRVAAKLHIRPRVVSGGALVAAMLLLIGFFSYQNIPNLRMRLASSRAGVHGEIPAYQPPGFHLNNISYQTGQINVSYKSNSDNRNFGVTQVASAWNSDTLRDKLKSNPQTANSVEVPDKGKTLFIYNDSNITWIDSGVLYKVEGDSKLSSDQLLRLANSL